MTVGDVACDWSVSNVMARCIVFVTVPPPDDAVVGVEGLLVVTVGLLSLAALSKDEDEDLTLKLPLLPPLLLLDMCCCAVVVVIMVVVVMIEAGTSPVAVVDALIGFNAERLLESKLESDTLRPREL
jgi:hypothetical protein